MQLCLSSHFRLLIQYLFESYSFGLRSADSFSKAAAICKRVIRFRLILLSVIILLNVVYIQFYADQIVLSAHLVNIGIKPTSRT